MSVPSVFKCKASSCVQATYEGFQSVAVCCHIVVYIQIINGVLWCFSVPSCLTDISVYLAAR